MARGLFGRSIRPPDDIVPNPNDPASVPPSTVGPDQLVEPGDPHGVIVAESAPAPPSPPARILPSAWSGWPAEWWPPNWNGHVQRLTDTAWSCVDLNASLLSTMPPFLVNAAPTLPAEWIRNPNPDLYTSWEEFAKQLFWDYQLGEAFVMATARYSSGWPARFHVLPPWTVNVEMDGGRRFYTVGEVNVTADILHLRYKSSVDDARGHGPLEAGAASLVAASVYQRYAAGLASSGGIPPAILYSEYEITPDQAAEIKADWINARLSNLGEPAVLQSGLKFDTPQVNPRDMALLDLAQFTDSRIAVMLGVPPFLVGLPTGGDSMTYSNVTSLFDYHWRAGLRPKAAAVMAGLSEWLLPRGTSVEVNKDAYVQPEPLQRAQTAQIYNAIQDADGNPVLTVEQIQAAEHITDLTAEGGPLVP